MTITTNIGAGTITLERGFYGSFEFDRDGLIVWNPANTFKYTITAAALAADRVLNLPLITGTDTLAALGLGQTWTANQIFNDSVKHYFGDASDAAIYYNATNLVINPAEVGTGVVYIGDGSTGANLKANRVGFGDSAVNANRIINMDISDSNTLRGLSCVLTYSGATGALRAMSFNVVHNGSSSSAAKAPIGGLFGAALATDTTGGVIVTGISAIAQHTVALANTSVATAYNFYGIKAEVTGVGSNTTDKEINAKSVWGTEPPAFTGATGTVNRWAGQFSGDVQINSDKRLLLEGSDTVMGDSYLTYVSATPSIEMYMDGTKEFEIDAGFVDATRGLKIGTGTEITQTLSATATLNFGSIAVNSSADLTITVTGAAVGDVVCLGIPDGAISGGTNCTEVVFSGWVSAADTVTIRAHNGVTGACDLASATFRAMVIKH